MQSAENEFDSHVYLLAAGACTAYTAEFRGALISENH